MRNSNEVITSQIPRAELAGLLETMTPVDQQRVTAEIAVVEVPGDDVVVRFMKPSIPDLPVVSLEPEKHLPRWAIVLGSCVFTLMLAGLMFAAA